MSDDSTPGSPGGSPPPPPEPPAGFPPPGSASPGPAEPDRPAEPGSPPTMPMPVQPGSPPTMPMPVQPGSPPTMPMPVQPGPSAGPPPAPAGASWGAPGGPAGPAAPSGGATPPRRGKRGWLIGGGIAAAAVLGGVATLAITGGGGDDGAAPATTAEVTTTVAQTTTTAATTTVATTVPETTAPATTSPPPVSMDELATSVVQILGRDAAGGPLCSGSGSIISADGLILTNAHVVENEGECAYESLAVALTEDPALAPVPTYLGEVVAFDPGLDLAVVRVATDLEGTAVSPSFEPIPIGDSDAVGLGDRIRILGYPGIGGDTITFTQGSVSGFTAESGVADRAWIKTDATIAGGNSGGTAVNDAGELVGVPTRAGPGGDVFADCRVVEDTNGDNVIDENDSCIPIGGFINGLRPVNLALPLIEQAKSGEPVDPVQDQVDIDLDLVRMTPPVFATEVGPDDAPVDVAEVVPVGTPQICGFWDYEGMVDGVVWDAIWSVDGTYDEGFSILGGQWTGGTDGVHWWVCAIGGDGGLQAGEYELSVYVADELIVSNTVFVGEYPVVDVTFDNQTGVDVCFLRLSPQTASNWGPDELDSDTVITAGTSVTLSEVGAVYDLLAETCDLEPVVQQFGVDLTAGGTVTLTP